MVRIALAFSISLVLLLFVISLIYTAITSANPPTTRRIIANLSTGIEVFRADWGMYPPSSAAQGGAMQYGCANLAYYLLGPNGRGWGRDAQTTGPFGGEVNGQFGPYYGVQDAGLDPTCVLDADKPPRPILYFRYDPDRNPPFDVRDNPVDATGQKGYASQAHLEQVIKIPLEGRSIWVRQDYILVSSGWDRVYGWAVKDNTSGQMRPAMPDEPGASYDDIGNW
ncbi:MAG: hypothetical protein IMZ44_02595 [Planctomycetes bacterium]|nr:hypothetical protein [Planctomycetota bacterium]